MSVLTVSQYLTNPTGKFSANVARRDRIRADLTARYRTLYQKYKKEFFLDWYRLKGDNAVLAKLRIPSEEFGSSKLYYDVFIQFNFHKGSKPVGVSVMFSKLRYLPIKIFSNSPNFMFTYTYVFNQADVLIDWMKPKMSKQALEEPPIKRNPDESFGFEKSVYFALLYLEDRVLHNPEIFMLDLPKSDILADFKTAGQKLKENQQVKKELLAHEKERAKKAKKLANPISSLLQRKATPQAAAQPAKSAKKKLGESSRKPLVTRRTRKTKRSR